MTSFKSLGLSTNLLKALKDLNFEKPTGIQEKAIPALINQDKDLIGLAQTGTGKTAAFGLPLLDKIDPTEKHIQALILAPTRELSQQILNQLKLFAKYQKLHMIAVYGGASIRDQMKDLKSNPQIICATPGRLIDLINRKKINLSEIQHLVLDEADEMLNMGFKEELDEILSHTPSEKNTWLFSATMAPQIRKIVSKYMDDPIEISINAENKVNKNIQHLNLQVRRNDKPEALMRILDMNPEMRGVIFCKTRKDTQQLAEYLLSKSYKADAIHGDLSQNQRDRVMDRFKSHQLKLLIATDVAARGIDVDDLTHVIHYTLPDDKAYYTHRAGRTARAGKKGISLVFASGRDGNKLRSLEKMLKISFEEIRLPKAKDIISHRLEKYCQNLADLDLGKGVDDETFNTARTIFEELTKEALIAKILVAQRNAMGISEEDKDLRDNERPRDDGRDRRGDGNRRRGEGRYRGSRGGRGRNRDGSGRDGSGRGGRYSSSKRRKPTAKRYGEDDRTSKERSNRYKNKSSEKGEKDSSSQSSRGRRDFKKRPKSSRYKK